MKRQTPTSALTEPCVTHCAATCSVVFQHPRNLSDPIIIEISVAGASPTASSKMNERMKLGCVATWFGLGASPVGDRTKVPRPEEIFVRFSNLLRVTGLEDTDD